MALKTQVNRLKEYSNENGKRKNPFSNKIDPRCAKFTGPSSEVNGETLC